MQICTKDHQQSKVIIGNSEMEQTKFSKIKQLQMVGFLTRVLDVQTLKLQPSKKLFLVFILNFFMRFTYAFKSVLTYFFPRESTMQLFIGKRVS